MLGLDIVRRVGLSLVDQTRGSGVGSGGGSRKARVKMRIKASRPTRRKEPTRATYSALCVDQTASAMSQTNNYLMQHAGRVARCHPQVEAPQERDRHLGGSSGGLLVPHRCVLSVNGWSVVLGRAILIKRALRADGDGVGIVNHVPCRPLPWRWPGG